jgi:hypothetical protein
LPPDVGEVSEGFDVMAAAALEDRIDDRGAAPGRGMLDEQPVLRPELGGADGLLSVRLLSMRASL